tara:strand:- start:198 stop:377 length:180 start_codon:yes stop_codon:yes gene_type:complete
MADLGKEEWDTSENDLELDGGMGKHTQFDDLALEDELDDVREVESGLAHTLASLRYVKR